MYIIILQLIVKSLSSKCEYFGFTLQRSCPDVKAEMFELLFQILHQNWRFFFKTSVLNSVHRTGAEEHMENEAQFIAAMQVCSTQI